MSYILQKLTLHSGVYRRLMTAIVLLCPLGVWVATRGAEAWAVMWAIASTQFFALKALSLDGRVGGVPPRRVLAYLFAWPGMNAGAFLAGKTDLVAAPGLGEWVAASLKTALGAGGLLWAVHNVDRHDALVTGWAGMLGLIFLLHFGAFHLVSVAWRRAGFNAPPIMRAPILATSLGEFWSTRWNVAFAESARRFLLRPMAKRYGAAAGGLAVFALSGGVHELVISLPARGGWGGPMLYFLIQAAGIAAERSAWGRARGLGAGAIGRAWTLGVTALPVALLFHAPFVERVIVPFLRALSNFHP